MICCLGTQRMVGVGAVGGGLRVMCVASRVYHRARLVTRAYCMMAGACCMMARACCIMAGACCMMAGACCMMAVTAVSQRRLQQGEEVCVRGPRLQRSWWLL